MQKSVMIFLFVLSLLVPSVLAATTVTDSAVITSGEVIGALNWSNLQSYPTPCAAGTYLTAVNDTTTCVSAIPSYTNIVLSNSTLMNTTILQLTSNLSGGSSGIANYNNIALTNQSNTLSGNQTITQLTVLSELTNLSGMILRTPRAPGSSEAVIQVNGYDLKLNSTGSNAKIIIGTNGMDFQYTNTSRLAVPRINGQITCNATSEGAIWWNTPGQVIQTCDGGGGNVKTFAYNTSGSGVTYGSTISGTTFSLLEGGDMGLILRNSNASAESSFMVASPGNSNGNTAFQIFVQGTTNNLLAGPFNQAADSVLIMSEGARQNRLVTSYGQNLTFNIGDGQGGLNATDQLLIGIDRVQVSPNILLTLQVNTTPIACNAANKGAIIFSTKHMGCDGTNWNFLY